MKPSALSLHASFEPEQNDHPITNHAQGIVATHRRQHLPFGTYTSSPPSRSISGALTGAGAAAAAAGTGAAGAAAAAGSGCSLPPSATARPPAAAAVAAAAGPVAAPSRVSSANEGPAAAASVSLPSAACSQTQQAHTERVANTRTWCQLYVLRAGQLRLSAQQSKFSPAGRHLQGSTLTASRLSSADSRTGHLGMGSTYCCTLCPGFLASTCSAGRYKVKGVNNAGDIAPTPY